MWVGTEWENVEDQDKNTGQNRQDGKFLGVIKDGLENVGKFWNVSEDIKDVNCVPLNSNEVTQNCSDNKDQNR